MNNQIILRIRSSQGQYRITINARDTFGELLLQLSKKLNSSVRDLIVQTEDGRTMSLPDGKKIGDIAYMRDGAILKVQSKSIKRKQNHHGVGVSQIQTTITSSKCNHPLGGKCLNCLSSNQELKKKPSKSGEEKQDDKPKCNHGPGGRCLNCTNFDPKDRQGKMKWMCQHGPNAKCVYCLDKQFISDIAHISFDQFLQDKKLKCKGVHPSDVKCGNCLPPSQIRYQVDKSCKNHDPYPKAMCNKCIPPNVVIKSQQFRHVDYVQFMNVDAVSSFVKYWVQKKQMAEQRMGFLYGYYAEDPHYKGGIRVIVEAIYEPKQRGTYNSFEILQTEKQMSRIDHLAEVGLGLEKVGWIYTQNNHDVVMSQQKVRMAARFQQENQVKHSSGYMISNFITVILRNDQKNHGQVKPQVFMISDQGQALQAYNLFDQTDERKHMKVKVPKSDKQALPGFISGGKPVTQFEPQFLLVKIGHGSSKSNKFAYLKKAQFPAKYQNGATKRDLKQYLKKNKHKPSHIKYGDFNLLIYIAELMDIQTAISIGNAVQDQGKVDEVLDQFVTQTAEL